MPEACHEKLRPKLAQAWLLRGAPSCPGAGGCELARRSMCRAGAAMPGPMKPTPKEAELCTAASSTRSRQPCEASPAAPCPAAAAAAGAGCPGACRHAVGVATPLLAERLACRSPPSSLSRLTHSASTPQSHGPCSCDRMPRLMLPLQQPARSKPSVAAPGGLLGGLLNGLLLLLLLSRVRAPSKIGCCCCWPTAAGAHAAASSPLLLAAASTASQHLAASRALVMRSPTPEMLTATPAPVLLLLLVPAARLLRCALPGGPPRSRAQQPHPYSAASPTRPSCFIARPPDDTPAAVRPCTQREAACGRARQQCTLPLQTAVAHSAGARQPCL